MTKVDGGKLSEILTSHELWLGDGPGGIRANLEGANLKGANLRGADFERANLDGADLRGADLFGADLQGADLEGANLFGADLRWANLKGAYPWRANLRGADLRGADLEGANLVEADLSGANLIGTCLDPMAPPNGDVDGFGNLGSKDWCIGYRSKRSPCCLSPQYEVGQLREAHAMSVADTECHPGIFACKTIADARTWSRGGPVVAVIFRPWECHRAGDKHRVRWLIVWQDIKTSKLGWEIKDE